jgi:hypothetical protein
MFSKTNFCVELQNFKHGIWTEILELHEGRSPYLAFGHRHFYRTLYLVQDAPCLCVTLRGQKPPGALWHISTVLAWTCNL